MGPRERCRRLEALLGALYDLGDEGGAAEPSGEEEPDGEEAAAAVAAAEADPDPDPGAGTASARAAGAGGRVRGGARDFFGELRAELRGAPAVPAAPAAAPAAPAAPVQVVVFSAPRRHRHREQHQHRHREQHRHRGQHRDRAAQTQKVSEEKNLNKHKHEFNFEKARLEVHRFGITGYEKQEQRVLERERAIMLGAKPPKREHVNYKAYQEKMREKRTMKDDGKQEHKGGSLKKKRKEQKERMTKKKKLVPSIWPAGQVGKFRDGTLILHSSDIKKIKSSKVIK